MVSEEILGPGEVTVKRTPLLEAPETDTTTFPVVAPLRTGMTMLVPLQLVAVPAAIALKVTVLPLWLVPKFPPVMATKAAIGPTSGPRLALLGPALTLYSMPSL